MNMKFMGILLHEGRKEDLKKKYSTKFNEEDLDFILNISDLGDFNHKYTDFVLKNTDGDGELDTNELEHLVGLIQDFDKYQSQFPKKDINQYVSVNELESVIDYVRTKKKEKEEEKKIDKVYEDNKFVVVKPKSEAASCKYGSSTTWCVTSRGTGHFDRYTSGAQELYFIINKVNSTDKNYSKVAVHYNQVAEPTFWDSQDKIMSDREVNILKYAYPEIIDAIETDFEEVSKSNKYKILNPIFDNEAITTKTQKNFLGTDLTLTVSVLAFELLSKILVTMESFGEPGKAQGFINISLDDKLIDNYYFIVTFSTEDKKSFSISLFLKRLAEGHNQWEKKEKDLVNLGLQGWGLQSKFLISGEPQLIAESIRNYIASKVMDHLKDNPILQQRLIGDSKVWRPDRFNYGYTFGKNKGLITKLVSYLDSKDIGTKLDFLESIGKLKSKKVDGKKLYAHSYSDKYFPSSQWRGHFSSFFASAKLSGILGYRKIGKDYFLIKGPNFDAFKSGQLKAL
jgi:hypothetical protein